VVELPIVTSRLVIDELAVDDAPAVVAYRSEPDVARFQAWTVPYTMQQAHALALDGQLALRESGRLVGDAMIAPVPAVAHAAEVGISLAPAAQGRGLAREAMTAMVDAIIAAGRAKVVAYVDARNAASLALFDRLGFRREGHLHHSYAADGLVDEILFGLTADQWRRPASALTVELEPHPADVAALDALLSRDNVRVVGVDDGTELAIFERDDLGRIVGGGAGIAWAGAAELRLLWVAPRRRGAGLGRRLLTAFEEAAAARGAQAVFVSTHTSQAPEFYAKFGYEVTGRWDGFPLGHGQVFLRKAL
jgi:RimJ/RimL family protein N-acetyltransferase/N-acetylglutamate synthase-like GNAT family acetyltransferase